ncbi:MFS transporter [Nocardioides plantarum]|uniref:MFS transporter n=1 Tax=Nocardioides plantarum TaxID=29299 RepID=A0ABV5K8F8_9ACTN|nr:MFS transporter [Nocardioides plantarum]
MSPTPPTAEQADPIIDDPRQRRAVLVAVCVALMAVIASVTGLNVAQPELAVDFDASQSEVLWFINLYTLSLAALLLPLGALGDRWGRKPMLLAGLTLFGLANASSAVATSTEMMLASRFVAGVGAAMIMPVTLAVITSTFPEEERAKGIGAWTAVGGGGGLLGMYLSAVLVDVASWRWLFALPIVLVVVAAAMTIRSVPSTREPSEHRFDTLGSVASMLAVLGLVYALHEGPVNGWDEPATLAALVIGAAATLGFARWELRQHAPLLDIRLFRDRRLATGSLSILVVFGVQAGILVVLFPFLQVVLGWSALHATAGMLPMAVLMMASSVLAPRVAQHAGSRRTMALGVGVVTLGLVLMATLVSVDGGYLSVLPGILSLGFGMGLAMTPSTEAITSSLSQNRQGLASALNDVTREFGTAIGVALLGAVLTAGYRNAIEPQLVGAPDDVARPAREGLANAVAAASDLDDPSDALINAARQSFVDGWQHAMWAGVAAMVALLLFIVLRPERPDRPDLDTAGTR